LLQDKGSGGKHVKKEKKLTNLGIEVFLLNIVGFCGILVHGNQVNVILDSSLSILF